MQSSQRHCLVLSLKVAKSLASRFASFDGIACYHFRYHNGTLVEERLDRFIFTRNNSLLILNARHADSGVWQLKDDLDGPCMISYKLELSGAYVLASF